MYKAVQLMSSLSFIFIKTNYIGKFLEMSKNVITFLLVKFKHVLQPVLEPNFDVAFGEVETGCQLDSSWSGYVPVEVELFFQFQQLSSRVRRPRSFVFFSVFGYLRRYCAHCFKCLLISFIKNSKAKKN